MPLYANTADIDYVSGCWKIDAFRACTEPIFFRYFDDLPVSPASFRRFEFSPAATRYTMLLMAPYTAASRLRVQRSHSTTPRRHCSYEDHVTDCFQKNMTFSSMKKKSGTATPRFPVSVTTVFSPRITLHALFHVRLFRCRHFSFATLPSRLLLLHSAARQQHCRCWRI